MALNSLARRCGYAAEVSDCEDDNSSLVTVGESSVSRAPESTVTRNTALPSGPNGGSGFFGLSGLLGFQTNKQNHDNQFLSQHATTNYSAITINNYAQQTDGGGMGGGTTVLLLLLLIFVMLFCIFFLYAVDVLGRWALPGPVTAILLVLVVLLVLYLNNLARHSNMGRALGLG